MAYLNDMSKERKTKILYIITKSNWGGAQRYVYDLAKNAHQSEDFEVVVAHGGQGLFNQKLNNANIRTIEIKNLRRDVDVFNDWKVFRELINILKEEKPDIIHLNSSKIGGLGSLAGRIARVKKIIFTAHGWPFNEDRGILFKIATMFLSWTTILLCHKTIVICEHDEKQALSMPFVSKKITQIYNGIENIEFDKNEDELRKLLFEKTHISEPKDSKEKIWIGTISELHKNKGLEYAIGAIEKIVKKHDVLFVIIGEGEERKNLEKLINKKSLEKNVILTGYINEAVKYLKAFNIFTLTSLKEGLPYVLLEAGLASLPVVASRTGGAPEIIDNMKSGIVVAPKNENEIFNSLQFLIENKKHTKKFGEELNKKIQKDFSLEEMIKKTFSLYT